MVKEDMNIFEKIMKARIGFLNSNPTKTGYNKLQNFKYFELVDIIPIAMRICDDLKLYTHISISEGKAVMSVIDMENPTGHMDSRVEFVIDVPAVTSEDFNKMMQDVGRGETYIRRYLYMLFLDIVEADSIDAEDQNKTKKPANSKFTTANNYKPIKSKARREAEKIVEGLEVKTLENAKSKLIEVCSNKRLPAKQCENIYEQLEVLLNAD